MSVCVEFLHLKENKSQLWHTPMFMDNASVYLSEDIRLKHYQNQQHFVYISIENILMNRVLTKIIVLITGVRSG